MIAYLFWHWPLPGTDVAEYEAAQRRFQAALNAAGGEGFQRAVSYRVEGVPWIPGGRGYEDWYLLDGSHALDPLNDLAVSPPLREVHAAAARSASGLGGLYRLVTGVPRVADGRVAWISKPRGTAYPDFYGRFAADAVLWRRQMVLGPGLEFMVEGDPPSDVAATVVERRLYG